MRVEELVVSEARGKVIGWRIHSEDWDGRKGPGHTWPKRGVNF